MSLIVYYAAMTLDGFIAEADDTIEWLTSYAGHWPGESVQPVEGGYDEFYERAGALVMGSITYEWILDNASGWPYGRKPTWVLSSRELRRPDAEGADVRVAAAPIAALAGEMGAAAGNRDVWVVGGGNVASQFADGGLLDEVRVTVVPVVLGVGKPLFDHRLPGGPMRLIEVAPRANGMVELAYSISR